MKRARDITGEPCHACGKGVAKVVHCKTKNHKDRFFFGCSASTEEKKCPGTRAWQSIEVPEEQKRAELQRKGLSVSRPAAAQAAQEEGAPALGRRSRAAAGVDSSDGSDDGGVVVTSTLTTRIKLVKAKKRRDDSVFWTTAQDDDYQE